MPEKNTPSATAPSIDKKLTNPFSIGLKGVNLMFLNAQGVAIFLIVLALLSRATNSYSSNTDTTASIPSTGALLQAIPVIVGVGLVAIAIVLVLTTFINGMGAYAGYRIARGEGTTFGEAFRAVRTNFGDLLWLQFLSGLKIAAWSLLFVIPGIVMSVRYSFAMLEYFDHQHKGNAAIKASIALSRRSWITIFAAQTVFNVVTLGFIQQLVVAGANAILYRQLSDTPNDQRPAAHGLSIATFVIAIIMAAAFVAGAVYVLATLHAGPASPAPGPLPTGHQA